MRVLCALAIVAGMACAGIAQANEPLIEFEDGDRVIFMGNTFAERLREFDFFETMLASALADKSLTFRNLAWSADEITLRPRPLDFGDIHTHLAEQKADVIFLCYGMNESFAGQPGLSQFRKDLGEFLRSMLARRYNGETTARLVLVSPMPQEPIEAFPNTVARNLVIADYVAAMKQVASAYDVAYLDLYSPITRLHQTGLIEPLTFNGVHLNEYGAWVVANIMVRGLGLSDGSSGITIDAATASADAQGATIENIVREKSALSFDIAWAHHLPPAMPSDHLAPINFQSIHPVLRVQNLDAGTYQLTHHGNVIASATHTDWAKGVTIYAHAPWSHTENLRGHIHDKNQLFFDRYRAINGYYIYGGRKKPFGVVSFPPEMSRFDELVSELDIAIHKLAQSPATASYELNPVGE